MNFVAKQVLKSKTGAFTDKFGEVTKKCKDLLESDEPEPVPAAQSLSEEEQLRQEAERRKQHYDAFNAEREEQRNKMREKYGLKSESSSQPANPTDATDNDFETEEVVEFKAEESSTKKDGDCSVM